MNVVINYFFIISQIQLEGEDKKSVLKCKVNN